MAGESGESVEARLRAAVEFSPSGLLMADANGVIVLVNREAERIFGYSREELLGRPVEELIPGRFRGGHLSLRRDYAAAPSERVMGAGRDLFGLRKDGTEVPIEIGLRPVATDDGTFVLASVVDITARRKAEDERRRLEEELRQAQKLEAIGILVGGIAHDFNNVLFGITGYAELIAKSRAPGEAAADLEELLKAARRGKDLIDRILVFSRREPAERRPLAIGATVEEAGRLLRATLPPSIEVRVTVDPELRRIFGDATSIHQVVMNLATNSAHAMPGGGVLEIRAEPLYLRDSVVRLHPGLHEGWYTVLSVRDTGSGMDPAVRERAFDPFFTTKPKGTGTGLGLSMVHSIVRAHEGAIDLDTAPGRGTTVICYFPALEAGAEEEREATRDAPEGHGERILLVEDEPSLAQMNARRLEILGYRTVVETDPVRALEAFRARPGDFDLLLTDHLMPRLPGLDLARAVHDARPALPIVLLTGYIDELPQEMLRAAGVLRLVRKPVDLRALGETLRAVLREGARLAGR